MKTYLLLLIAVLALGLAGFTGCRKAAPRTSGPPPAAAEYRDFIRVFVGARAQSPSFPVAVVDAISGQTYYREAGPLLTTAHFALDNSGIAMDDKGQRRELQIGIGSLIASRLVQDVRARRPQLNESIFVYMVGNYCNVQMNDPYNLVSILYPDEQQAKAALDRIRALEVPEYVDLVRVYMGSTSKSDQYPVAVQDAVTGSQYFRGDQPLITTVDLDRGDMSLIDNVNHERIELHIGLRSEDVQDTYRRVTRNVARSGGRVFVFVLGDYCHARTIDDEQPHVIVWFDNEKTATDKMAHIRNSVSK